MYAIQIIIYFVHIESYSSYQSHITNILQILKITCHTVKSPLTDDLVPDILAGFFVGNLEGMKERRTKM